MIRTSVMEAEETKPLSGYGKPPWIFKGSALYQLHLVKAEIARAFIPKELKLVEAFGYTLGGFFLANYDDSPVGIFDELVVIAGIVWNPPTSCAWAARVLVNSEEACIHGRKDVGLPSQVAKFSKGTKAVQRTPRVKIDGFLNLMGVGSAWYRPKNGMDMQVIEIAGSVESSICNMGLSSAVTQVDPTMWMGPTVKMSLPSFSGRTEYNPHLLKYACQIECRVRPVSPAKVTPSPALHSSSTSGNEDSHLQKVEENKRDLSISVMLSKPILALQFSCLKMQVEAPVTISQGCHSSIQD